MRKISKIPFLRKLGLPLLRLTAMDILIRHPYVPSLRVSLNSFKHKGYWFHRSRREQDTMELFSKMIKPGMHVVEVGGHIGFISVYFMHLVGPQGSVDVFEPGANNLPYIRKNLAAAEKLKSSIILWETAVGDRKGEVRFYEDSLTGQNNSAIRDFAGLKQNAAAAFSSAATTERVVPMTTLDAEFSSGNVDFIKIDVEGFEKSVIIGAQEVIESHTPLMMVEVQADESFLFQFFTKRGYLMYLESGKKVSHPSQLAKNVFMLHRTTHAGVLRSVFPNSSLVQ